MIEISESSYATDRGPKWRRSAAARIGLYWIVSLNTRRLEVFSNSSGRGRSATYRQVTTFHEGEEVPVVLDGREVGRVSVGDIMPQP